MITTTNSIPVEPLTFDKLSRSYLEAKKCGDKIKRLNAEIRRLLAINPSLLNLVVKKDQRGQR